VTRKSTVTPVGKAATPRCGAPSATASEPFGSEFRLDHGGHFFGLILELPEQFVVVIVAGPAGEQKEILGLIPPGFEPIRARRHRAMEEALEPVEWVGGRFHKGLSLALEGKPLHDEARYSFPPVVIMGAGIGE